MIDGGRQTRGNSSINSTQALTITATNFIFLTMASSAVSRMLSHLRTLPL